jgi:hypothetical protein
MAGICNHPSNEACTCTVKNDPTSCSLKACFYDESDPLFDKCVCDDVLDFLTCRINKDPACTDPSNPACTNCVGVSQGFTCSYIPACLDETDSSCSCTDISDASTCTVEPQCVDENNEFCAC